MSIVYVNTPEALTAAINEMCQETTFLAVDTEFRREDTYFPQLCLVQVATQQTIFLIDAVALKDISPFFTILENPNILKVLHSGRQDLEIFCQLMEGRVVSSVFDTQIAAMFLGQGDTPGFETLVQKLLDVSVDKSSRHTDWMQRPLTEAQKSYAVDDVLHLRPLYSLLVKQLEERGRVKWAQEESKLLENAELLIPVPLNAWKRLSISSAPPREMLAIQKLAEWREFTAQQANVPRSWVVRDESILAIAKRLPTNVEALKKGGRLQLSDDLLLQEILDLVQEVLEAEEDNLPRPHKKHTVVSKNQHGLLEVLKLLLQVIANELHLSPKVVAEKEQLVLFVLNKGDLKKMPELTTGWRKAAFWDVAIEMYVGKLCLHVNNERVTIDSQHEKS